MSGIHANSDIKRISMPNSHRVKAKGFSSGIWILWKGYAEVVVEVNNAQFVHLKAKFPNFYDWVFLTGVYDSPRKVKQWGL